jgi:hypothetical protein
MTLNLPEKALSGKGSGPGCVIGEFCGYLPQASGKLPDTHPVGSFCDNNLGVFMVTKIAMENTDAVPPAYPVPRTPKAACPGLHRGRAPRVPLTRLARLTTGQSLCTGHVDASLEKLVALWPSPIRTAGAEGSRYFAKLASQRSAPSPAKRRQLINTGRRGSVHP